jgi:DNA-binding response OmpR family regulator
MQQARVLVVEDELPIARGLADCLVFRGHQPECCHDGDEGCQRSCSGKHELLILDRMLPGTDGLHICRAVRAAGLTVPILFVTARGEEQDILDGFAAGADDYVTKPFSVAQLLARVDALLRRGSGRVVDADPMWSWQGVLFDSGSLLASCDDRSVELSRRDMDLLFLLHQEAGRIVSRRRLLNEVWDYDRPECVQTRSVDMHLVKLRRKLQQVAPDVTFVETVRGEGYRALGVP